MPWMISTCSGRSGVAAGTSALIPLKDAWPLRDSCSRTGGALQAASRKGEKAASIGRSVQEK